MRTVFEIDPGLVAEAIKEGRNLRVEVFTHGGRVYKKCALGGPSRKLEIR